MRSDRYNRACSIISLCYCGEREINQETQRASLHDLPLATLNIISANSTSIASMLQDASRVSQLMNGTIVQAAVAASVPRVISEWRIAIRRW